MSQYYFCMLNTVCVRVFLDYKEQIGHVSFKFACPKDENIVFFNNARAQGITQTKKYIIGFNFFPLALIHRLSCESSGFC